MFGRNKIEKRLDDLQHQIDLLKVIDWKMEVEKLKTHVSSLRGLVNRKYAGEKSEEPEKENNKNSVIIPM